MHQAKRLTHALLRRPHATSLIGLLGIGCIIRLLVLMSTASSGLYSDMVEYHDRAAYVFRTGSLYPDMFRMPLTSIVWAACMWMSPEHPLMMIRLVNVLADAVMIVVAFETAWRLAGHRAALYAGGVMTLYPPLILYCVYIMPETIFTATLLCAVALATARPTLPRAAGAGVCAGLANLTRSAGLVLVPVVPLVVCVAAIYHSRTRRQAVILGAVSLLACSLTMSPWVVRNAMVFGAPRWTDTSGGVVFLMANNPIATGRPEGVHWEFAMKQLEGVQSGSERSREGYRLGLHYSIEHPLDATVLLAKKLRHMCALDGREHAWAYSAGYFGERTAVTVLGWAVALMLGFPVVVVGVLAGITRGNLEEPTILGCLLVCGAGLAMHLLTYGDARYHLPFVPLLAVLGAAQFRRLQRSKTAMRWAVPVSVALIAVWTADLQELVPQLLVLLRPGGSAAGFLY